MRHPSYLVLTCSPTKSRQRGKPDQRGGGGLSDVTDAGNNTLNNDAIHDSVSRPGDNTPDRNSAPPQTMSQAFTGGRLQQWAPSAVHY